MSRLSSPMVLILIVVVGWVAARASYIGWSSAMNEGGRGAIMPVPMLPLGPLPPLTMANRAQIVAGPASGQQQDAAHFAVHIAPRGTPTFPQSVYNSANEGSGEAPLYVRQQLALLRAILHSARNANSAPFGTSALSQYGMTGAPQSMIAPTVPPAAT
ncbi:MAG: hypothetical protein ABL874_10485, partial [Sphingopyxis sp.]